MPSKYEIKLLLVYCSVFIAILTPSICCAQESVRHEKLREIIRSTMNVQWVSIHDQNNGINESRFDEFQENLPRMSEHVATCFEENTNNKYDDDDIATFYELIFQYSDLVDPPNWKKKLDILVDARYGNGTSKLHLDCKRWDIQSRECSVSRTYGVVSMALILELSTCIQNAPPPARQGELNAEKPNASRK